MKKVSKLMVMVVIMGFSFSSVAKKSASAAKKAKLNRIVQKRNRRVLKLNQSAATKKTYKNTLGRKISNVKRGLAEMTSAEAKKSLEILELNPRASKDMKLHKDQVEKLLRAYESVKDVAPQFKAISYREALIAEGIKIPDFLSCRI